MGLEVLKTVGNVNPRPFQCASPLQVIALVEPGLQLDHRGDLLAGSGGREKTFDDGRFRADPVQSLLDPLDGRIPLGGVDELLHRPKSVKGMVHEHVGGSDRLKKQIVGG